MSNKKFWNYNRRDFAFNIIELIYVMKLDWRFSEYTALIASVKVSKQTNNKTNNQAKIIPNLPKQSVKREKRDLTNMT